jgi:hypothetical protein
MWNFVMPALTAVGINSGMNLLRRKPIFENAGTAAVTGGVLGGFGQPGGVFGSSSSPLSAGGISNGAVTNALAGGDVGKGLAMNASALAGSGGMTAGSSYIPGSIESVMGQAGADGVFRNPDYFANILGSPVYTGNEGLLSQIGTGAGSLFDTAKANLPDITPQNLLGVSSVLSNMNSLPRPVASGANTITGTPYKFDPFQTGQVYTRKRGNR